MLLNRGMIFGNGGLGVTCSRATAALLANPNVQYPASHLGILTSLKILCSASPSSSRVLLEKLIVTQLVKKLPVFYGTRRFITVFTRACHKCLSWARCIQFTPSHPVSHRSIL